MGDIVQPPMQKKDGISYPAQYGLNILLAAFSDTANLQYTTRAIYVNDVTAGNVIVVTLAGMPDGQKVTFKNLQVGVLYPWCVKRIWAGDSGSTVSEVIALW